MTVSVGRLVRSGRVRQAINQVSTTPQYQPATKISIVSRFFDRKCPPISTKANQERLVILLYHLHTLLYIRRLRWIR